MVNKVFLIGRLGKDPAIKHFQNDNAIAEFPLATTETYKDRDGKWVEITDWHNVKLPTKYMAERAEKFLKKGSQIFVEGKIRTRSYDDKENNKRYVTEIIAETFRLLDKKSDGTAIESSPSSQPETAPQESEAAAPAVDDDLPF